MIFGAYDYIAVMEKLGLFTPRHRTPDCNSDVWRAYLKLYETHIGGLEKIQVVCTPQGLGFYLDPLEETDWYTWALLGPMSHPTLPFTAEQLVTRSRDIFETFIGDGIPEPTIVSETFDLQGAPTHTEKFLWINSPRARIHNKFESYVEGLSAPRRKQLRRLFRTYDEDPAFRFDFSGNCPDNVELDWVIEHTNKRWGEEWNYALVQSLWPIAVASVMPERARFMRVYNQDKLAFINSYIVRDEFLLSQATCRNEDLFFSGLGVMIDFKTIETLSGNGEGIRHLDPTCRVSAEEYSESIVIAKREVVNEDHAKPLMLAGYALPEIEGAPILDGRKGWITPLQALAIGKVA